MAMGQQKDRQGDLMVSWSEMPRSPGHVFYDRLQLVLIEGGFDGFAEAVCQPYYAARMGAPSVPPGRYFRMHLVGYFEGIDSERGLEWRCSDSLSLREFLLLERRERVPDHSWLSRTRARLPHEVHTAVLDWVLALIAEAGLVKGERIGVDASTMEANAARRNIVRRDTGEGYRGMLERLAHAVDLVRQANWQKVGGASPPERRSNRTTFLREPCVGSREGAGEASVAAWMGRAIEHRKSDGPGCRGFQIGRRQYRRRRFGEMSASPAVSENPCTFARLLLGPWEVFKLPRLS